MINNFITFSLRYYTYPGAFLFLVLTMLIKKTEIILIAIYQDVFLNQIPKKVLIEKIDNFLKILEKISKRKKWLINVSKQKLIMDKSKFKKVFTRTLNYFEKKDFQF